MSEIQTVGDGKYGIEVDEEQHRIRTIRNGEYWQEETGNKFLYGVWEDLRDLRAQLSAANKRLEEAEMKEPVGVLEEFIGDGLFSFRAYVGANVGETLYTSPIPPADVAELQQESDRLVARNIQLSYRITELEQTVERWEIADNERNLEIAKLERKYAETSVAFGDCNAKLLIAVRKLAEQQATMAHAYVTLKACEESDEPNHGVSEAVRVLSKVDCKELEVLTAEAREEGRKEAVPEGWQAVPNEPTEDQWDGLARDIIFWHDTDAKRTGIRLLEFLERIGQEIPQWLRDEPEVANGNYLSKGTRAVIVYRAMLAAAPSPASLNAKEGGE